MNIDLTEKQTKKMDIDRIKVSTNVRVEQDSDRIDFFKELLDAGQQLPPIWICNGNEIIDGRNRLAAYELAGKTKIDVIDFGNLEKSEILFYALEANSNGAKPSTPKDVERVIVQLIALKIERNVVISRIANMGFGKYANKIFENARRSSDRDNARNAAKTVRSGVATPEEAAKTFKVSKMLVLSELGHKKNNKTAVEHAKKIKDRIKDMAKHYSKQFAKDLEKTVTDLYLDKEFNEKQVENILEIAQGHLDSFNKNTSGAIERLRNLINVTKMEE